MQTRIWRKIASAACLVAAIVIGVLSFMLPSALAQPMFSDVPETHWAWGFIEELANSGVTGGCLADDPGTPENEARYCPDDVVTRAQMAIFIEASIGVTLDFLPACSGTVFGDVSAGTVGDAVCRFIEDFAERGITGGCGGGNYCPNDPVTRQQMAVFLEVAMGRIPDPLPELCKGIFTDVGSVTEPEQFVCRIIEDFAGLGITGGCSSNPPLYCPNDPVTRAQMAVFLVAAPLGPTNRAPNAVNDTGLTTENNPVTMAVLTNDSDLDGDTLTITGVTQGSNGTVTFTTTTVTYTPNAGFWGTDQFTYTISDGHGGVDTGAVTVQVTPTEPPPDPGTVAPPIDPTVATTMATATGFLYTGANPIQTGVSPGTIEARRAAVLRGKVLDRNGNPLPAVTITILNHPEFGQTLSRLDGMFDLAVNGGGYLTVRYRKAGYLEAQRQINVPWQDYVWAPDLALVPLDSQATVIDLTAAAPFQVARGNVTADERGNRQSTLLFPQGTQAEIVLPNGTTQPISNLTVRSTEYTVGPNGPKAMPALLPLGVEYTYAVELSVDEALTAGRPRSSSTNPLSNMSRIFLPSTRGWLFRLIITTELGVCGFLRRMGE